MKPKFFLLGGLLWLSACSKDQPPQQASSDAPVENNAQKSSGECQGIPLPDICNTNCNSLECYEAVLNQHRVAVADTHKYIKDKGPFIYYDLGFGGILEEAECDSRFIFQIYQESNSGPWLSKVTVDTFQYATARAFPIPLMRAIKQKYSSDFVAAHFYWLNKSPQCPNAPDAMIDLVLKDNKHAFYDLSLPPQ